MKAKKIIVSVCSMVLIMASVIGLAIPANAAGKKNYSLTYVAGRPSSLNTIEKRLTLTASGASNVTINTSSFYRSSEEAYASAYITNYSTTGSARIQNTGKTHVYYLGTAPISGKNVSFTIKLQKYGQVGAISASGTVSS